jgi:hypothetical protein
MPRPARLYAATRSAEGEPSRCLLPSAVCRRIQSLTFVATSVTDGVKSRMEAT